MARKKAKPRRSNLLTDQLRQAIDDSGLTRYRIAKETGISESTMSNFISGKAGLSMEILDRVTTFLRIDLTEPGNKAK